MHKTLMTIDEIAAKYEMHPRTASSRLERENYEGFYQGTSGLLCFYIDDKADAILKKPVRHTHRHRRRLMEQQELPLPTAEPKQENRQESSDLESGEKVVVALAVELPDVSVTVKAI